jgi:NAD(P)-dependent dehydrogenase (short-subunit alcohol dehydrogenase family)
MTPNRTAIVTGAARGIGLAVTWTLTEQGFVVVATDADDEGLAAAALPTSAKRAVFDLSGNPDTWLTTIKHEMGTPAVLVNNAAHMDGRSFLELPMDAVRRSLDVTLFGTWALTRSVVQQMIEDGQRGSVVFNLSLHTSRVRMCPDYSVAKAGLSMLVKELASELGPFGIRVNAVSPGAIDTWSDRVPDASVRRARSEALVPLGRLGAADDVAKAIAFLADDEASGYVTGADLRVDGGLDQYNWLHHLYGTAEAERRQTP